MKMITGTPVPQGDSKNDDNLTILLEKSVWLIHETIFTKPLDKKKKTNERHFFWTTRKPLGRHLKQRSLRKKGTFVQQIFVFSSTI